MLGVSSVVGLINASVSVANSVYQSVVDAIELGRQQQLAVADVVSDWAFAVAFVTLAMDQRRLLTDGKGDTDSDTESEASEAAAHPVESVHSKIHHATQSGVQRLRQFKMRYRASSTGEQVRRASSCDTEPPVKTAEAQAAPEPETQHAKHSGVHLLRSFGNRYTRSASTGEPARKAITSEQQQEQEHHHEAQQQHEQVEHESSHRPPTPSPPPTPKGPGLFRQLKTRYRSSSACEPVRRPSNSEAERAAPAEAHALLTPTNAAHPAKESGIQRLRRLGRYRASSACDPVQQQQQQQEYSDSSDDDSSDDEDTNGNNQLVPKLSRAQRLRQMRMKYRASSAEMARKFTDIVASEARDAAVSVGSRLSVTRDAAAHVGARLSVTRDAAAHVGARLSMFAIRTKSSSTDFDSPDLPETPRGDGMPLTPVKSDMPPTPTTPTTPMPPTPTTPTTPTEMWADDEDDDVEGPMPPTPTTPTTPNAIWEGEEGEEDEDEDEDVDGPLPPTPTTPTGPAEMWGDDSNDDNDDDDNLPPTPTTPTEPAKLWDEAAINEDEALPPSPTTPTTPKEMWTGNNEQEEFECENDSASVMEEKIKVESPTAEQPLMQP